MSIDVQKQINTNNPIQSVTRKATLIQNNRRVYTRRMMFNRADTLSSIKNSPQYPRADENDADQPQSTR
jgi:hypothetical protein